MFEFIREIFIGFLTGLAVNVSSHTKCISLSNKKCEIQPALISLYPVKNYTIIHVRLN